MKFPRIDIDMYKFYKIGVFVWGCFYYEYYGIRG